MTTEYIRPINIKDDKLSRAYEACTTAIAGLVRGVSFRALENPPLPEDVKPSKKPELHLEVKVPKKWTRELDKSIVEQAQIIGAKTGTDILVNPSWAK